MKKGFSKVALDLVFENHGSTAEEIARMALDRGLAVSDARDPVNSLASTLAKQVREDRVPGILRIDGGGLFLYSPASVAFRVQVEMRLSAVNTATGREISTATSGEGTNLHQALEAALASRKVSSDVPAHYVEWRFGFREIRQAIAKK